jgi:hypothetical protein
MRLSAARLLLEVRQQIDRERGLLAFRGTGWTCAGARIYDPRVPSLFLTDAELATALEAARRVVRRIQRDAMLEPNTMIRNRCAAEAEPYRQLAKKFDGALLRAGSA